MARILESDGSAVTDPARIAQRLAALGIALNRWPVPDDARTRVLLERQALSDAEKDELLVSVDHRFEALKRSHGYRTRDMVVIHEGIAGLKDVLAKFESIHYHTDDEVRYILAGRGYFGFVESSGRQFMLEVTGSDYINVPANTEHWFTMKDSARIKAVRYFIDTSGWTPVYTERALLFG